MIDKQSEIYKIYFSDTNGNVVDSRDFCKTIYDSASTTTHEYTIETYEQNENMFREILEGEDLYCLLMLLID